MVSVNVMAVSEATFVVMMLKFGGVTVFVGTSEVVTERPVLVDNVAMVALVAVIVIVVVFVVHVADVFDVFTVNVKNVVVVVHLALISSS